MSPHAALVNVIRDAFSAVEYPGDWCLAGSTEGKEPRLLAGEFAGKDDWRRLDASFLDEAPGGFGTALSFFSDEAFRFYLPAYLVADVEGKLARADPVFHLTHGLDDASREERINPRRYGERTWLDHAKHRFAVFDDAQRAAIAAYLRHKLATGTLVDFEAARVEQALDAYWARSR